MISRSLPQKAWASEKLQAHRPLQPSGSAGHQRNQALQPSGSAGQNKNQIIPKTLTFQTFDGVLFFFGSKRSTGNSSVIMASKQCCGLTMGRARQDSIGVCCVRPMFYSIVKTRIAFGQGRHTGRQAGRSTHAQYIWLPHSCLCQTDIWKSFEMVRS